MAKSLFEVKEELVFNKGILSMINDNSDKGKITVERGNLMVYDTGHIDDDVHSIYILDARDNTRCVHYDNYSGFFDIGDYFVMDTFNVDSNGDYSYDATIIDVKTLDVMNIYTDIVESTYDETFIYIVKKDSIVVIDSGTAREIHEETIIHKGEYLSIADHDIYITDTDRFTLMEHAFSDMCLLLDRQERKCCKVFHNNNLRVGNGVGICSMVIKDVEAKRVICVTLGSNVYTPDEFFEHFGITINNIEYEEALELHTVRGINKYIGTTADGKSFEVDGVFDNMRVDNKAIKNNTKPEDVFGIA